MRLTRKKGYDRLQRIQGCPPAEVASRLGVMARVLVGGTIHAGDRAVLAEPERDGFDRGE